MMIIINGVGVMHTQQDCVMGISEGLALTHIFADPAHALLLYSNPH